MKNVKDFIWKRKIYFFIALPILAVILYFIFGGKTGDSQIYSVKRENVEQSVVLSGEVKTGDRADLGFATAGRISRIYVSNNQKVNEGQILAQLEIGDLLADLKIKQANLRSSNVELDAAKNELEKITKEENTKVESAYRTLLSDGLVFIPDSELYDIDPPTLTGIYDGAEGKYKVIIEKNLASLDYTLRVFGLERTERPIIKEGSTPFGTRGLYISFPEDVSLYDDTTWYVEIPNRATSSYVANYNKYNEAKRAHDLAIEQATSKYEKLLAESRGENYSSGIAEAEIQKINAEIRKNTIHAPFKGIVTNIEKEIGENASTGERVISVLGEQKLEVVLQVSELDVSRLVPGMTVQVSLDAFPEEIFEGKLKTINSRETEIEGVPVYEAFVDVGADPRIKTGMSAKGTIVLTSKNNVVAIPSYFVTKNGEINTVVVLTSSGKKETREVKLGLTGSDSIVEILSGLKEGDKIVSTSKK